MPGERAGRAGLVGWIWLAPPWLLGALLRCWNLRDQVIAGDELHSVWFARQMTIPEILTTFGARSDYCLPLTALDRGLVDLGVPLSETILRAPVLAFGLAFLALAPLAVARAHGRRVGVAFAWLAATSPWLVQYSRISRPYVPMVALATGALLALERACTTGSSAAWRLWALFTALALWFLPVAAPFLLAPLLAVVGRIVLGGAAAARERIRELSGGLAWFGLAAAALLLPAFGSLIGAIAARAQRGRSDAADWWASLRMLAGSRSSLWCVALLAAAVAGWLAIGRRNRFATAAAGAAVAAQAAALLVVRPYGLGSALVLTRYLSPVLPVLLIGVAAGLAAALSGLGRRRRLWASAAPVALAALAVGVGPLPSAWASGSSLGLHSDRLTYDHAAPSELAPPLPAAYRSPPVRRARVLLEAPFLEQWDTTRSVLLADVRQHKRVRLGTDFVATVASVARFRTLIGLAPRQVLACDADVLVYHRDVLADEQRAAGILLGREPPRTHGPSELARMAQLTARTRSRLREYRRAFGRPDYRDGGYVVWDLDRVRRKLAARGGGRSGTGPVR